MSRKLITAPATEPVTLAEAKLHCKTDYSGTTEDALINQLISAARGEAENEIRRALITQTWEKYLDAFPEGIELFYPPFISLTSIVYVDINGTPQTLAGTEYAVDDKQEPAWVVPAYGKVWPDTRGDTINAVTVRFVCGYGAAADVPAGIKAWLLIRIGDLYQNRDTITVGGGVNTSVIPTRFVDSLLDRYRISPPL
jgi:uncharacterized phiE125 gp8 family phage protein